jgi:uncharacterized protein YjbJ (UPF0337 family)
MSLKDKSMNIIDPAKGTAKQTSGRIEGNEDREAEGKVERSVADLKQAGEKAKDAFRH